MDFGTHFNEFIASNPDPISGTIAEILKKIPIHIGDPVRGDVIVLKPHVDSSREHYIKRVIGLPGEQIKIGSGHVFVKKVGANDFVQINEPYLSATNAGQTFVSESGEDKIFTVPAGHYWVMGDNRRNSSDSRNCFKSCSIANSSNFLAREDIVGKVSVSFGYFNIFEKDHFPKLGKLSWEVKPRFLDTPKNATYPELDK